LKQIGAVFPSVEVMEEDVTIQWTAMDKTLLIFSLLTIPIAFMYI